MAGAGLLGGYLSGSMGAGRRVEAPEVNQGAYQWGGSPQAAADERRRLLEQEQAGRANATGARTSQQEAVGLYSQMARGQGPSAGQAMLAQGMQRANADAANLAASARGGGGAQQAALRRAQDQQAMGAADAAAKAAALRAQEQQAGIAGLAASAGQMRGQDIGAYQGDLGASAQIAGQDLQARMAAEEARLRGEMWAAGQNQQAQQAARAREAALWSNLSGGGASMLGMGLGGK
jgi:hypothetical protein